MIRTLAIASMVCLLPLAAAQREEGAFRIGDGVSKPELTKRVQPEYTAEAKAARIEGAVLLTVVISKEGKAEVLEARARNLKNKDTGAESPNDYGLVDQARAALKKWEFKPGMKDGKPVSVRANIEVNFRLE